MKKKDVFQIIDEIDETKKRDECTVYRNTIECVFSLPEKEQLNVFRAIFLYSLYGINTNFDAFLEKNRQKKKQNRLKITSFENVFSLLKKQRIGWETATKSANSNQTPQGGSLEDTPSPSIKYKDISIKDKGIKGIGGMGKEETYNEEMERVKREMEEERRKRNEQ